MSSFRAVRRWFVEQPKLVLFVLLAVDLAFILADVLASPRRGSMLSLYTDRGPAGLWGVGQALVSAWIVYLVFRRTQVVVYLAWAVTFAVVAVDDFAEVHEIVGQGLARQLEIPGALGLRGADLGELLVWALIGIPLLLALYFTNRGADVRGRWDSLVFFVLMSLLVVAGAGFDALHMALVEDYEAPHPLGVAEDGGELIALSLLLSSALTARRARDTDASLTEPVAVVSP